jgi:hypothetical protein
MTEAPVHAPQGMDSIPVASGMCLAPSQAPPSPEEMEHVGGGLAAVPLSLSCLASVWLPRKDILHCTFHIRRWSQSIAESSKWPGIAHTPWGEATTVPNQFFYWRVWLHLPELWHSHILGSELRQEELWIHPNPSSIHCHLLFWRILFIASKKYSCSAEFHTKLNPLIKHMEERDFLQCHLRELWANASFYICKLNGCMQKCVWKGISECGDRCHLNADCRGTQPVERGKDPWEPDHTAMCILPTQA